jgi:hypothetical protein
LDILKASANRNRARQEIGTMNFKRDQIEIAWEHGRTLAEADPAVWRQDACGAWIRRDQFGHEASEFGWKIENVAHGGPATNAPVLRPFHCRNGFDAANRKEHCAVRADRAGVPAGEFVRPPRNRAVHAGAGMESFTPGAPAP